MVEYGAWALYVLFFSSSTYLINSKSQYDIFTFRPLLVPFFGTFVKDIITGGKSEGRVKCRISNEYSVHHALQEGSSHKSPSYIILSFFVGGAIKSLHTNASFSI